MNQQQFEAMFSNTNLLVQQAEQPFSHIKPTDFFCEGWMTNFVLNLAANGCDLLPFRFNHNATWGSEMGLRSWLPTRPEHRVGTTWADAVVGQISIRPGTKRGLRLADDADQFIVFEAKMNSPLSAKTSNADGFDQAARNVICMAIELCEHQMTVDQFESLAFYVASPAEFVEVNRALVSVENVLVKFANRFERLPDNEKPALRELETGYLLPLLDRVELRCITWEEIIETAENERSEDHDWLNAYYLQTREFAE